MLRAASEFITPNREPNLEDEEAISGEGEAEEDSYEGEVGGEEMDRPRGWKCT